MKLTKFKSSINKTGSSSDVDTGRKLNVHKTFRRRSEDGEASPALF